MRIDLDDFRRIGEGLRRPEDVIEAGDGRIYAAHHNNCVGRIEPDGRFTALGPKVGAPNGLAIDGQGDIIIADFGIFDRGKGPLHRFNPDSGVVSTIVGEIDGVALTSCNYPAIDKAGNIWCTHSTYAPTFIIAMLDQVADGFIFVVTPAGDVRVVATDLPFPNGCAISPDGDYLYVCRTSTADVVRFPILAGPSLGPMEIVCEPLGAIAPPGTKLQETSHDYRLTLGYTDGCAFDAEGLLWVALPAANKVVRLHPGGRVDTVISDPSGTIINHPTNISWGGPGLETLYLGSIIMPYVPTAKSPVPGFPKPHQR
jgi:gluconolactonase